MSVSYLTQTSTLMTPECPSIDQQPDQDTLDLNLKSPGKDSSAVRQETIPGHGTIFATTAGEIRH